MAKPLKRLKAGDLRREGKSIRTIAKELGVSRSSASNWCRNIELTKEQREKLRRNAIKAGHRGRMIGARMNREKKLRRIASMKKEAKEEIGKVTERDLFMLGIGLYWGEGSKSYNKFMIVNSDPDIIVTSYNFFTTALKIPKEDIRLRVQINAIHEPRIDEVLKFWRDLLNLSEDQIQKPYYVNVKSKKVYKNYESYYGIARMKVVKGSDLLYKMLGYIEEISPR